MSKGWISIHRKMQDHWLWLDKPFSRGQAWIDILMMVNHTDTKIVLGNDLIEVKRGSRITSIRKLCDRWQWSNTKVKNFLKLLEEDNMLVVISDTKKTTLTVVNYSDYQYQGDSESDTKATQERQTSDTKATRKHTNNNDNNDNNENNDNKKDVDAHFEKMWSLYPEKRVKKQVSSKSKKDIYKLGEEFERCITRYKKYVEGRRKTDFKDLSYQNGSTFFNGGYMDYLDSNVKEKEKPKRPPLKKVYREL